MNNSHFIDFGPTCWNNRTIITEAKSKIDNDASMDDIIHKALLANFKSARTRPHKSISIDSKRYKIRRISPERAKLNIGNKYESVASTEPYILDTVNTIFALMPQLKDSGALTGYVRYALTNRWVNRPQFNARDLNKLEEAVNNNDVDRQKDILIALIDKRKTDKTKAGEFLSFDNDKKLRNIAAWRKLKLITNPYFNKQSAEEFVNADQKKQFKILKKWGMVTLPTTTPSAIVVRYCSNVNLFTTMINDAQHINDDKGKTDIDKDLYNDKFEREATKQGVSEVDRKFMRNLLASIHDTHKDLRDYSPDELLNMQKDQEKRWNDMFDSSNIDWSKDDDDDE